MAGLRLYDMHVHLGWFADPASVARDLAALGVGALAVTVTPEEHRLLEAALAPEKNVALAAGLHPWWVRAAPDADALCELARRVRFVGEIGLDASPRRVATWDAQLAAFERACAVCAGASEASAPKVLSIHAVRAAGATLDVLERTGAAESCRCVLHWFSGTSEELWRAVRLGCRFSFGERSLATRRGREYVRVLPAERLLTETDLPEAEGARTGAREVAASLERAAAGIAAARGTEAATVCELTASNAAALLGV
ncbi:MAG TPA: TatD family hydrolase [Candidatus Olsenella pullistercoris]|uniref:TatD family hydrolase n=1 Tax=Candidatus Olsenella pullistercoris TaxID=2838712 RepID=A0A9D2F079_9ACTN|nr:TatD family hydrolase [Candidatus Olsenella pullistercoris]